MIVRLVSFLDTRYLVSRFTTHQTRSTENIGDPSVGRRAIHATFTDSRVPRSESTSHAHILQTRERFARGEPPGYYGGRAI